MVSERDLAAGLVPFLHPTLLNQSLSVAGVLSRIIIRLKHNNHNYVAVVAFLVFGPYGGLPSTRPLVLHSHDGLLEVTPSVVRTSIRRSARPVTALIPVVSEKQQQQV